MKSLSVSLLEPFSGLTSVVGEHLVQEIPHPQDLLGLQLDVARLPTTPTVGLMEQDPGVWKRESLAFGTCGQEHGRRRRGLAKTEGRFVGSHVLKCVVDREQRGDIATGGVDVDVDVLLGILRFEKQHLGAHQVRDRVVDGRAYEDDPLAKQS